MKFLAVSSIALLLAQQALAIPAAGCVQTHIITATDSCTSVAAQFQITEAEFYSMNPGLHHSVQHDCDNLDTGKPFCVCMKAPCPVKEAVAPAANSTAPAASSAAAGNATVATAPMASASPMASTVTSMTSTPLASASPMAPTVASSNSSASATAAASSQPAAAKSSAAMTTAFGAVTIGLVMTATSMLL